MVMIGSALFALISATSALESAAFSLPEIDETWAVPHLPVEMDGSHSNSMSPKLGVKWASKVASAPRKCATKGVNAFAKCQRDLRYRNTAHSEEVVKATTPTPKTTAASPQEPLETKDEEVVQFDPFGNEDEDEATPPSGVVDRAALEDACAHLDDQHDERVVCMVNEVLDNHQADGTLSLETKDDGKVQVVNYDAANAQDRVVFEDMMTDTSLLLAGQ